MDAFVAMPVGGTRESFFPPTLRERFESTFDVRWTDRDRQLSESELAEEVGEAEVLVTGWGSPQVTAAVLDAAPELQVLAHTGGSVATYASAACYDRGVTVLSANDEMARFVAEQVVASVVAWRRRLPQFDRAMRDGEWDAGETVESLRGADVGLVGLGTIGRFLLDHLQSWDVSVTVYDPYLDDGALDDWPFATRGELADALESDVVSLHASLTPETEGMLGPDELARVPDGAVFVNTARAALVDEAALRAELESGRIDAVLDVFHDEPLPADDPLREMNNVLLTPHTGGSRVRPPLTASVLDDLERYERGEPLEHAVSREQWQLMTR